MPVLRESLRTVLFKLPDGRNVYDSPEFDSSRGWYLDRGLNMGCGTRQPVCDMVRVDKDPKVHPDVCLDMGDIPWSHITGEPFNYTLFSHSIEHCCNWDSVLRQALDLSHYAVLILWDRVISGHMRDHCFAWTIDEARNVLCDFGYSILDSGTAEANRSYYLVVQ